MNWRLTSEIIAYVVPSEKMVFLAATEKKQYQVDVIKLIGDYVYQEIRLYENQFDLKFGGNDNSFDLYLKCSELPNEWFKVANFYKPGIWSLIEDHIITNGNFESKFEVIFESKLPYVSFIEPGMKGFKKCFEEMRRRMNCEICRKTTKWVPGHRYDSYTESIFPLASVRIRKTSLTNSEYLRNFEEMPEVWIYVNELKDEKTINDVLKNRSFGNNPEDLKILYKTKTMVDSGEVLKNDFSGDIKDYWLPIYDNAYKSGKPLKEILDTFSVTSNTTTTVSIPKSEIADLTTELIEKILINCWDEENLRKDLMVGNSIDEKDNIERSKKLFTNEISDINFLKGLYYPELYKDLGVSIDDSARDAVQKISGLKFNFDFDTYLNYIDFWRHPSRIDTTKCYSKQRVKSTNYKLDTIFLKDLYGESSELKDTILDALNHIRDNFGLGSTEYSLVNVGSKKDPKEYIICKLTLEDIIKYKKGVSNMSENLKQEIIQNHFVWIQIVFDKDGIIT